jgi:hypothetical protein
MLVTIAVILVVLWLLGFITKVTLGGFIHLLLLLAIVVVLIRVIQAGTGLAGRRRVRGTPFRLRGTRVRAGAERRPARLSIPRCRPLREIG